MVDRVTGDEDTDGPSNPGGVINGSACEEPRESASWVENDIPRLLSNADS